LTLVAGANNLTRMIVTDWGHVKELLHQVLSLEPERRAKFLDEVCASNPALREELESLLTANEQMSAEFLQAPPADHWRAAGDELEAAGKGYGAVLMEGQLFAQRFQLIRRLGEGGMGQVWLAEQIAPVRRQVALKLIRAGMYDETALQRFDSERQSLAIMEHPAIAKVFDAGATPHGQPYFVMEYVPGLPITQYCDERKLKIRERVELFVQACEGVQHAHQKAVIHRDLKPANILVVEVDGKPRPRIIDFGLAKATTVALADETLVTRWGNFIGTPGYMSPEQVDPGTLDIDTRTDVYSLGVILYILLTGLQPFETKRRERPPLHEWLRQLREDEPPLPSSKVSGDRDTATTTSAARGTEPNHLARELRGDLDWIVLKSLERDRTRRYGTPTALAADLRRYLNHAPVEARPASAAYQIHKFMRRHRIAAGFIAMVTLLSIVASGAALIAVSKQREAEYQARQALQAQSRLLTQASAQRLKDSDVEGAQGIILEVLTDPRFAQGQMPAAISVFQESRAADAQLAVLSAQGNRAYSAAYSPDGTRIVTASEDKTARIWDANTGALLSVLSGHAAVVSSAAYSPDGTRIVTASEDKTARIWDAHTGKQLAALFGHANSVFTAVFSPDGTRIVTASDDKTARIWDAHSGKQLAVLAGHDSFVYSAAYSPDGTRIVTASDDKTARIWDAHSGKQLAVLAGHDNIVYAGAYSPDGTRIVTASADKTARIWDARTGAQLAVLTGHGDMVQTAVYSPDGTRILTASNDKTARIWDADTAEPLTVIAGHASMVYSAAYSPDGTRIVTASADRTGRIWVARIGSQLAVLSGHRNFVYNAAYSPNGNRIVTASADKTARIWDAHSGTLVAVLSGHDGVVRSAAYSPDGTRVVTASADSTARIWDADSGEQLAVLTGHSRQVFSAVYSPDGARIVTASADKTARIWDARSGQQLAVLAGHGNFVNSATYSPDGTRIVTGSGDKTARIWDARTGKQLAVLSGHGDIVQSAAYSPDGTHVVTASNDKTARIWDARTGMQLAVLSGHGAIVHSAAYSPDGTRIVTGSNDKTARIWDARTGTQLAVLPGHGDFVYSVAFSPDGTRIVTASPDKTARIWDAHIPAGIEAQITWAASALINPLPDVERAELGLPPDSRARTWSAVGSVCDRAAAAFYDPERVAAGVSQPNINEDIANPACAEEMTSSKHSPRSEYQMGRVLMAKGDVGGARVRFEGAVAKGYRAARVDLADLLANSSSTEDADRAASLYEQAWRSGVSIAAFRLGHLYEAGSNAPQAWIWFQRGRDAGEPNALARFAERAENNAAAERDLSKRNEQLVQAFSLYATAAQRARDEAWPDDVQSHWRYRRASLARVLAQEGLMQRVADAYQSQR
jgi:WD40 repeat protein/serine/threonine protein kinase